MSVVTSIALPVVRTPVLLAKALAAIDLLSQGRLIVGVGPGSNPADYEAVGIPWQERWKRLEEAILALRALWLPDSPAFDGRYYSTRGVQMSPYPIQQPPPIWIGSWGSEAGLRRVARLADGWLASGYNTSPGALVDTRARLRTHLESAGRDPEGFPNALVTLFLHITEDRQSARSILEEVLSPILHRSPEELQERLPVGPAALCAEKLAEYAAAGMQRAFLWPVEDEVTQLELFRERVEPSLPRPTT